MDTSKEIIDNDDAPTRREPIEIGLAGVLYTALECRTVRIGSFKYSPLERVVFTSRGIRIMAPTIDDNRKHEILHIQHREVIKILVHFGKTLPVIFIYILPSSTKYVREKLNMVDRKEGLYFDSCAKEEMFKRITLLPESITEEHTNILKKLYGKPSVILDELSARDANEILIKTCPREKTVESGTQSRDLSNEIRQILIYPPGKGGISINTEDYGSLAQDQFLNDVIIDFYLKYLCKELLSDELRNKTHVFSSFFYKRLTTKAEKNNRSDTSENKLTAAQKRHIRVKNWTKNVNLFEKDFIVIPINESSHWFLAIVCFPGMKGPHTFDGNKPIDEDLSDRVKKDKGSPSELTIGATTITPVSKPNSAASLNTISKNNIFGEEERDEADGTDSDLEGSASEPENEDAPAKNAPKVAIKQPCILIFDSLAGGISRQRVVATLRDYLTCEFQSRTGTADAFDKFTMRGACPKVPQQNNFTDCGLYLLQYVEQFFKVPITNYSLPIKQLTDWFEEIVVTRKREEISELIKSLVANCNPDSLPLPDIPFPTVNGKLIDAEMPDVSEDYEDQFTEIEEADEEEEPYEEEEEEGEGYPDGDTSFSQESENGHSQDETRHNTSNSVKRAMTDSESESDGVSPVQRRMKISDYDTKHNGFSEFM